ncbi:MAG: hypothetical protein QGF94_01320 [Candidatus Thalassarchaeaceae archaeon]|nr:hypothetical protein [Candidatus Thalassarchaeaceae archaeon]
MAINRKAALGFILTFMMLTVPWASADTSQWIGPNKISSSGQDVSVDGWNVPGNATILDSWMTVENEMIHAGNGSEWRVDTSHNFSVGQFTDTTMGHFDGRLSLLPDAAVSNIDSFLGQVTLNFASGWSESGNSSIWEPSIPATINGSTVGNVRQLSHGNIPAAAHSGSTVAATLAGQPVPAGEDATLVSAPTTLPSPINHFNFTMWNWRHTDAAAGDAVWVEYKLDNGAWTWIEPVGGYNANVTMNAGSTPAGTPSGSSTFPAWSDSTETGWVQETFNLDNITSINSSTQITFRFNIHTTANSSGMPGWFIDDLSITNVGGASNYWLHGCYTSSASTCGYSNGASAALQRSFNLSSAGTGSTLRTVLEWDLEGSYYDNFWVEMSTNNATWTDLTGTGTNGVPYTGYSVGGTTYTGETGGFITMDLAIPSTFQGQNTVYLRYRVQTDSSVTYGYPMDNLEGLILDSISVLDGSGNLVVSDPLNSQSTMFHYAITTGGVQGADDWQYISIGAGALSLSDGFENSAAGAPGGHPTGWSSTGDWDFGPISSTASVGATSFTTAPFGFGINLGGSYSGSNWDHLYTPPYSIPSGASARLTFNHWMCAESNYDGGAVFISTDNQTWTHFDPGNNWYDATGLPFNGAANLAGVGIFDGRNAVPAGGFGCQGPHNVWNTKTGDLTAYSGQTVWFRFSFESDSIVNYDGWYLDDIGLEVDYFLADGDWVSDIVQMDEVGLGIIDIDGTIPDNTWATGTVLDAAGNQINGFENLSFPISLHGLDRASYLGGIRVKISMGTDDPFLTPLIEAVHVGSVRLLDARGTGNGWDVHPSLDLWESNLTNNGSAVLQINAPFVHSSRPITGVDFTGTGSQVTLRIVDAAGNVIGTSGLTGSIQFPQPQPGFGVRIEVNPGGHISSLWSEGDFGQPAENPTADVTNDGTVDWSFPMGASYGLHGWQQYIHEAADGTISTAQNRQTTSDLNLYASQVETVSVLIPEDAIVTSGAVSIYCGGCGAPVDLSIGSSTTSSFGSGLNTISLNPSQIAYINMISSQSGLQTDRDWRVVEFNMSSNLSVGGIAQIGEVTAITLGYSISENLTGLTQQMIDYHGLATVGGNVASVDIPVTYNANRGAVIIGGGIYHELMITNYPFTSPGTMYPDSQVIEIKTRHRHLYDNNEISKIALGGMASDGTSIVFEVNDPANTAIFTQTSGSNQLPMELDCTVNDVNGILEVTWRFQVSWTWDDVASITWSALAYNQSGLGIAPATAQTGGQGSQAIENDLEISGFLVHNEAGFDVSNQFSPDYPYHMRSGDDVTVSGHVRFQNTVAHRPMQSDFAMLVNLSGQELPLIVDGNGTYSGTITLPNGDNNTLSPSIGRVGPVTGATGANDTTISSPMVTILIDDEAPVAESFEVSTSVGLLDANGYVWDPISPLTVHITVSDAQDRDDVAILHYWREGIDDSNDDGFAQASEYQSMSESLFSLRSGSQQISFNGIQVAANGFNGKVSLWLEGTDWAGNSYQDGGTGGGPGLGNDWATLQTAQNTETVLLNTGFSIDTINQHLLAGQHHTISMTIQDANGVETLDDIGIYLAGQSYAPLGEFHYDPRQETLSEVPGSHVTPHGVVVTVLSEDTSRIDLTFSLDWDTPATQSYRVPGVTVTDDMQIVSNVNNLNDLRWKIDNELIAVVTDLVDLTPPVSQGTNTQIHVKQGDEISIDGVIQYGSTGTPLTVPSDNLSIRTQILYGSTVLERVVSVQQGGTFSAALVLPARAPLHSEMPIELTVLNVPGLGTTVPNTNTTIVVDSTTPEVVFDPYRFPTTSLAYLESDRLNPVSLDILIFEEGGFPTTPLTMEWQFLRNGVPRLGVGGSGTLEFVEIVEDSYHYTGTFDLMPTDGQRLDDGDQIIIWFSGEDLAGNPLSGEGTEQSPRVPTLAIIEFVPILTNWEISPNPPDFGAMVSVEVGFSNEGLRGGQINVSLVERLGDIWHIVTENKTLSLNPMQSNVTAEFEWEAWQEGPTSLYIIIDGDESNRIEVPMSDVQPLASGSGFESGTILLVSVIGLLVMVVLILLVIVIRRPSGVADDEYDGDFDDDWEDEPSGHRLDFENETLWNTLARHGIHDKPGFLEHAYGYDCDNDGFLDADELDRAAADFTGMLAKSTVAVEKECPLDYNDETVAHVISQHGILDRDAFLDYARDFDTDGNGYLKQSELDQAASQFVDSGLNQSPEPGPADPRAIAIAEVKAALPDWAEKRIIAWMDKGWSATQIIQHHAPASPPPAPTGFGDGFEESTTDDVQDSEIEAAPEVDGEIEPVVEVDIEPIPSEAKLKRLKKAELVELAEQRNIDSSGTKGEIISRLLE